MKLSWANAKKMYAAVAAALAAGIAQGFITGTAAHWVTSGLGVIAAAIAVYFAPKNADPAPKA